MLKKLKIESSLIWVIITGLIICNGVLIAQNIKLRQVVERQYNEKRTQVGDDFNGLKVSDENRKSIEISSSESIKKIILFSSTECPFCKKQNPFWVQLIDEIDDKKYTVFILFNDGEENSKVNEYMKSAGYLNTKKLAKSLFSDSETLQKYKLNGTPATLVIDENGIVEKVWTGLWDKTKIAEVEAYFRITINR